MKLSIPAITLVAVSQLAGVAVAADASVQLPRQVVRYADLDLSRTEGAATLYARIGAAARNVCAPRDDSWLRAVGRSQQCFELALARAVADVDAPVLTNYYLARIGQLPSAAKSAALRREPAASDSGSGGE